MIMFLSIILIVNRIFIIGTIKWWLALCFSIWCFIGLFMSHCHFSLRLIFQVVWICTFLFALVSMIFSSGPPFFTLFISFYYISNDSIFNCCSSAMSYRVCNLIKKFVSCLEISLFCWHYIESAFIILLTLIYIFSFLQYHRDIKLNLGPRKLKINSFSICHWNLSSSAAHNFCKLTQLIA